MSRKQERACYPESSRSDGCFPENNTKPPRFGWETTDAPRPSDLLSLFGLRDRKQPKRKSSRG